MSASFEKTTSKKNFQIGSTHTVLESLDALSSGACDPETFLAIVIDLMRRAPDTSWEVLSLLDQNYRRGKIRPELFQRLKARLQSVALGTPGGEAQQSSTPSVGDTAGTTSPIAIDDIEHRAALADAPAAVVAAAPRPAIQAFPAATSAPAATFHETIASRKRFYMGDLLRGRYRLARVISQGSGASMFETDDEFFLDLPDPGRRVALKMLSPSVAADLTAYANVRREFQRLQALSHPNILRVHDFDRDGDSAFFTMELLSGASLRRVMRVRDQAALVKAHALAIVRTVGDVLIFAIAAGVSHGLISLRNIFITEDGDLRILDFGTAEMLDGQNPNLLDDPYALACVAYTLLSGKHPYQNRPAVEARAAGLQPARPPGLSGRQWRALRAGLSLERSERPSSVAEWLYRLDPRREAAPLPTLAELERGDAPSGASRPAYGVIALIVLLGAIAAWAVLYPQAAEVALSRLTSFATSASSFVAEKLTGLHLRENTPAKTTEALTSSEQPGSTPEPRARQSPARPTIPAVSPAAPSAAAAGISEVVAQRAEPSMTAGAAATSAKTPTAPAPAGGAAHPEPATARVEFAVDTTEVASTDPAAHVVVRRKGNLHNEASFTWWTESGTAKAGADFSPVAAHVTQFEAGKDRVDLIVPIVTDATRKATKNFYVVIDEPGPGTALGNRRLSMVSIVPADGG